jgi:uncharacterized protein YjbI with pentapeptide repeats
MGNIKNQVDFEKELKRDIKKHPLFNTYYITSRIFYGESKTEDLLIIENITIENLDFQRCSFSGFQFKNCIFKNFSFDRDISISACIFKDCTFENVTLNDIHCTETDFINTSFNNCMHSYNIFGDCLFTNTIFANSKEMLEMYFGGCIIKDLKFVSSFVVHSRFINTNEEDTKIVFLDCILEKSYLYDMNLQQSSFVDTALNQNSFNYCTLAADTIAPSTKSTAKEFSSIDFQSIINSSNLKAIVLNQCFGIHASDIKDYIFSLTQKIEFQSVFISYSFKDKQFAKRLNDSLLSKGVFTFLWEKDAPPGKTLKKIMKENVKKHDRIIFIASLNSIRSKACQFELTEGRHKQAELWTEIFFPIHIDNYLFEVEKYDIKPVSNQDEYWQNIMEVREINSMDFSPFASENYNQEKYDNMIFKLVKELKK